MKTILILDTQTAIWASEKPDYLGKKSQRMISENSEVGISSISVVEFNMKYRDEMEKQGLVISGTSPDGTLAEVVELRKTGKGDLTWHLDSAEVADLTGAQKQYQRADPWQDEVAEWLAGQMAPVTVREALTDALHIEARDQTKAAVMRCAGILAACGLVKKRQQVKGEQVWRWSRADSTS